jgi:hypothetical protein
MFRQPINATFTLSDGANGEDQTFSGIMVAAPMAVAANAELRKKLLLDGFIGKIFCWFIGLQFTNFGFKKILFKKRFTLNFEIGIF